MNEKTIADAIQLIKHGITYQLEPDDEGGYVITVIDYPTCVTQGETIDEALSNAEDALLGCLVVDHEAGFPISKTLQTWMVWAKQVYE